MYELINDVKVKVKEYKGQRVVTFTDVDTVHERPTGTAKKRFYDNRKHFIEGEDFFFVKPTDVQKSEKRTFGFEIPNRGIILLTESGYLMLVKSFTDDLSWSVQRQLVKTYFRVSEITASYNNALIIEKLELLEHKIDILEKNSKSRADSIMKTLFDISSNVIVTSFEFIYNKLFE